MAMKYIISDTGIPVVFSELQQHRDVARAMFKKVVGAGFCYIAEDRMVTCYGESISLGIKSRGDVDSSILNRAFGLTD
jgi:hypothetical protein